jgi:hypothetical protein
MIVPTLWLYSVRSAPRWLRQVGLGSDPELAALCRQHWRKPRAGRAPIPVTLEAGERRPNR